MSILSLLRVACGVAFFDLNLCQSCDIPTLVHVEHGPLSSVFAAVSGNAFRVDRNIRVPNRAHPNTPALA